MSIINGHGWQNTAIAQQRTLPAVSGVDAQAYQSETATASTVSTVASAAASRNASGSTYQDAKDAQDEAFAKLKVALQNSSTSDAASSLTQSDETTTTSSAAQEFRDYMALSPAEKIRLKMLSELGLTEDDYAALPPEEKEKIDLQIAQRVKEETEIKSMASLEPQMQAAMTAQTLTRSVSEVEATDPAQLRKDRENREDPLKT